MGRGPSQAGRVGQHGGGGDYPVGGAGSLSGRRAVD